VLAAIAVFGVTLTGFGMHLAQVLLGERLKSSVAAGSPDFAAVALMGLTGFAVLAASACAWVFVPVWMYRAAANLRGLGRHGMVFSPGGCAGWFFVPIASLWKPVQAMSEIWRASNPQADELDWDTSSGTPLIAVWWSAWIMSNIVSLVALAAQSSPADQGSIGLASNALSAVAAVALVMLMRGVSARQEQAIARLNGNG
jgi:hypothetical protein